LPGSGAVLFIDTRKPSGVILKNQRKQLLRLFCEGLPLSPGKGPNLNGIKKKEKEELRKNDHSGSLLLRLS
jgi:hypothetical protein